MELYPITLSSNCNFASANIFHNSNYTRFGFAIWSRLGFVEHRFCLWSDLAQLRKSKSNKNWTSKHYNNHAKIVTNSKINSAWTQTQTIFQPDKKSTELFQTWHPCFSLKYQPSGFLLSEKQHKHNQNLTHCFLIKNPLNCSNFCQLHLIKPIFFGKCLWQKWFNGFV